MVKAIDCVADAQAQAYAREQAIRKNSERLVLELLHANDLGMVSKGYLCRVVYNLYADNDKLTRELFKAAPNHERFANLPPDQWSRVSELCWKEGKEPATDVVQ